MTVEDLTLCVAFFVLNVLISVLIGFFVYDVGKRHGYREAWSVIVESLATNHAELTVRKWEKK